MHATPGDLIVKTLTKVMFVCLLSALPGPQAEGQGDAWDKLYVVNNATATPLFISAWSTGGTQQQPIVPPLKFEVSGVQGCFMYLPLAMFPNAAPESIVLWGEEAGKQARALTNRQVGISSRSQNIWVMDLKPLAVPGTMEAFEYLNKVRQAPANFSQEIGADLSAVQARHSLVWNATLAQVAQKKAQDMATRSYSNHTTPEGLGINKMMNDAGYKLAPYMLQRDSDNWFESIAWGFSSGPETIKSLIQDMFDANLGHRKHLLGTDASNAKCVDIGIGFAANPNSTHKFYWSIIAAYHE
jgi:uncharacterized protein YkwD